EVIDKKFAATEAYDVELLREVEKEVGISKPVGCESFIIMKTVPVDFQAEVSLSEETKNKLDSEVADLFRIHHESRFCVQASGDAGKTGKDYQLLTDTSRARTAAIIDYLSKRYDRRPSEFIPDVTLSELTAAGKSSAYIRITVVSRKFDSP